MKVVVCEKPSVARDIAQHLRASRRSEGAYEGNGWTVTWAFGHLVELQEPEDYDPALKRWNLESLPIVPAPFKLRARGDKGARAQLAVVKRLLKEATEVVCATDAGREGELIFRYLLSFARAEKKPVQRLWVSSLTAEALAQGFARLRPSAEFDNLYRAARCRSEADWLVGINSTRALTVTRGGRGRLWSVGRVQTPVLSLIVQRDGEIENFKEEDYWELHTVYRTVRFKHLSGKFARESEARATFDKVHGQNFVVTELTEKTDAYKPPLLYDLTDLQKDMNRRYGLSADHTLKAAQSLYEKKLLSYPRTDSRYLSADVARELPALFQKLRELRPREILGADVSRARDNKRLVNDLKVTDHHAIIPTGARPSGLDANEQRVFDAVVIRLIAALYPDALKRNTVARGESAGEKFRASGSFTVDEGWEALYPRRAEPGVSGGAGFAGGFTGGAGESDAANAAADSAANALADNAAIRDLRAHESGPHAPEIKTLKTRPPLRYNEATLLQAMEGAGKVVEDEALRAALKERGLGTPATRAAIIETLLRRGYVDRAKKNIVSTSLGRELISLIPDHRLKSAELTGEWEARLKKIENGQDDPDSFLASVVQHVRDVLAQLRNAPSVTGATGAANLIGASSSAATADHDWGQCPLCQAAIMPGQRGWGCSRWKEGCKFAFVPPTGVKVQVLASQWRALLKGQRVGPFAVASSETTETATGETWVALEKDAAGRIGAVPAQAPLLPPSSAGASTRAAENSLGACPLCGPRSGGQVEESAKAYGCHRWREGCKFTVWKTVAKKKISLKVLREILRDGRSSLLKGFRAKSGKTFDAHLVLRDGEVTFEFPSAARQASPELAAPREEKTT